MLFKKAYFSKNNFMLTFMSSGNGFEKLELIKKYFQRVFNIFSKEIREELQELEPQLSNEEFKEIKKELAFLPKEKQQEYLHELKEEINE
jgi:hypothetical protein